MSTNLDVLSNATGLEQMLKEFQEQIQQQVQELCHKVAALKEDYMNPTPTEVVGPRRYFLQQRLLPSVGPNST